jgi:hypothetical protein
LRRAPRCGGPGRRSTNTFEQLNIHHIMDTGLFINVGGGNLVLNTDSHDYYDAESADGFGAHHMKAGTPATSSAAAGPGERR